MYRPVLSIIVARSRVRKAVGGGPQTDEQIYIAPPVLSARATTIAISPLYAAARAKATAV